MQSITLNGSKQTEHANNFTLLRVLLAVMVVFGHFRLLSGGVTGRFPYNLADAAVDAFFVVSGFLITGSFERSRGVTGFYIRRAFRVIPLYALVVLLQATALIVFLRVRGLSIPIGETSKYLLFNLGFANFAQHDIGGLLESRLLVPTMNPSLWTLKIEIGFYLIAPLVYAAMRRWGEWVLLPIFLASACFEVSLRHLGLDQYARQLPGQMQFFVVGIALYHHADKIRINLPLAVICCIAFFMAWTWLWPIPAGIRPLIVGVFVVCFALRLPVIPLRSDLSYGSYLMHGPLIQILLFLGFYQDTVWMLAGVMITVMAMSFLTEHLVEKPGIELGKRLARRTERQRLPKGILLSEPAKKV
jgi:peptidoglycan/LPS O-acetylase OafA/YrhL